jgi:cholesterol transport system auxiliary component
MKEPFPSLPTRRLFLLGGVGATLAGCSLPNFEELIGPPDPLQLYVLRPAWPPQPAQAAGPPLRWQLAVAVPDAPASLDSARIALNPTPNTFDYYANASWIDRAPLLLQSLLLEGFSNTRRVSATRDTIGLAADYVLYTDLRSFQAQYENLVLPPPTPEGEEPPPVPPGPAPRVVVTMEARLMAIPDRRIIGSFNAAGNSNAGANSVEAVVLAFNQATGAALSQIIEWTLRTPPAV